MDTRDKDIAEQLLNTVIQHIEHGDVNGMMEQEIKNYFMMCQQIEIYHEKFMAKGFYLIHDPQEGAILTRSPDHNMIYDLGLLADRLLDKFCRELRSNHLLGPAVRVYIDTYGAARFTRFLQAVTSTREAFSLTTVMGRACENGYNLEGPLFMDCMETIALGPRGMPRVKDLVNEFCTDDISAETLVAMLATEHKEARFLSEIKHTILEKLEKKYQEQPKSRMWLLMVCSMNLIHAVNSFLPFMEFLLKLIRSLSDSITFDSATDSYYSPPGHLSFNNLIHIMSKFYRNAKTQQNIINFIFNQFTADAKVWGSVLKACHERPTEDTTAEMFYDSLYRKEFTDPNISRESLQLFLRSILHTDHLQMAAALGIPPPLTYPEFSVVKSDEPQQPPICDCINAPAIMGPADKQIDSKPGLNQEFPGLEMGPCSHPGAEVVVTKLVVSQTSLETPSKKGKSVKKWTVVQLGRRPSSARVRRYPKRMDDFWA